MNAHWITDGRRVEHARLVCVGPHAYHVTHNGNRECATCGVDDGDPVRGYFFQRISPTAWALRNAEGRVHCWIDERPIEDDDDE